MGLSFRGTLLAGVLLLTEDTREIPLAVPAFEDAGEAVTALTVGEDMQLVCFGSTPPTLWLFTHLNLDFFKKAELTWQWLVRDVGFLDRFFDTLARAARGGTVFPAMGTADFRLLSPLDLLVTESFFCN